MFIVFINYNLFCIVLFFFLNILYIIFSFEKYMEKYFILLLICWGLYVEYLGEEMKLYKMDYDL